SLFSHVSLSYYLPPHILPSLPYTTLFRSTGAKVGWVILGLVILSISLSNMYALIAIVAGFILYWIYKNWNKEEDAPISTIEHNDDPFTNFEYEWRELTDKKI